MGEPCATQATIYRFDSPEVIRSLRNDKQISRQYNFHIQNFVVVAFPTKTSVFGRFSSLPHKAPFLKSENFIFIVVSPSLSDSLAQTDLPELSQKNPRVRKNSCPQFWGRKWLRQFYGRLEFLRSLCRKTSMSIKFLFFWGWGGILGLGGGVPILFLWARGLF